MIGILKVGMMESESGELESERFGWRRQQMPENAEEPWEERSSSMILCSWGSGRTSSSWSRGERRARVASRSGNWSAMARTR